MDLAAAEGLADLIAAETELQRRQAVRIMSGSLSELVDSWRSAILRACALIEVSIDWVDEEVPEDVRPEVRGILETLSGNLGVELQRSKTSQRVRAGFEVAILGAPNVGKSTLLNRLAGREAAIVSDRPGTTRDVLEVRYDLGGIPVTFLDTAGIRTVEDEVEAIGVARALDRARHADIRLILQTPDRSAGSLVEDVLVDGDIVSWSKADLGYDASGLKISGRTGEGIDALLDLIHERLIARAADGGLIAHLRHEEAVSNCRVVLVEVIEGLDRDALEISAERLRIAAVHLERIVGRIDTEAVLDTVFGSFCLGK